MGKGNAFVKKGVLTCLAGCCIGMGVGMILYANIGGDTVTVFQDGLHRLLHCSYGQASRIYNFVLIVAALLVARKYFGVGTIISALITGYAIDISFNALTALALRLPVLAALLLFLLGQTVYTFGLSLLIRCDLGMNGLDSLLYQVSDRFGAEYKYIRLGADFLLTLIGYLMGGVVGAGTVISIVCTGFMIDFFVRFEKRGKGSGALDK